MTADPQPLRDRAERVLRAIVGHDDARLRDDQWEAISVLVSQRRRAVVVQRTGWGKSAVYFVATALLRANGAGPTLIVSPLLALMRNQVEAAGRAGIHARTINSGNVEEWAEIEADLVAGRVDVLLVSPERLNNPDFRDRVLPSLADRVGLLVVDEAHCISDWGHDFRPDYRRIRDVLHRLATDVPVLATTATANARVVRDVADQLGHNAFVQRGSLERDSLRLGVLTLRTAGERLGWLAQHLADLAGSGIIYTLTVAAAEEVARFLRGVGHDVLPYTGRSDPTERLSAEASLIDNRVKALVATSALGMGFDKPDLGFVVHLGAPQSPIAYYQQVGRAGRAVQQADVLLLPGSDDEAIWRYFASVAFPNEDQVKRVLSALDDAVTPLSTAALETVVDIRRSRLELMLKVLDVDGAVRRVRGGWESARQPWVYDSERYARVDAARMLEQQAMRDYLATTGCRMEFLRRQLDDPYAAACGRCDNCDGAFYPVEVSSSSQAAAVAELTRPGVEIAARTQWPTAMNRFGLPIRGRIPDAERVLAGRAVARFSDLGWGSRLRDLLAPGAPDQLIPDGLADAVIQMLAAWGWDRRPGAVLAMPSRTRPRIIGSAAEQIAAVGRLPYLGRLDYRGTGPSGGPGGNSAFRLAAVYDQFVVPAEVAVVFRRLDAPVLLVDDFTDSRWTLTVAGRELLLAGAPGVLPMALASAG